MPLGGQVSDTGITIRAIAIDQASGRLRAIAAEARMLPAQFSQAERLSFLSKAFGREQGAAFAAIVRDGGPALESLLSLAAAYPAVSDEAGI